MRNDPSLMWNPETQRMIEGKPRPTVVMPDSTPDADFAAFIVTVRKLYGSFDIDEAAEAAIRTMADAEAYAEELRMSPAEEARFEGIHGRSQNRGAVPQRAAWRQSRCVGHRTCLFRAWKAATEAARHSVEVAAV
jgi:hypothetical protein